MRSISQPVKFEKCLPKRFEFIAFKTEMVFVYNDRDITF